MQSSALQMSPSPRFPTYESFYDEETMALVTEIYAQDFENVSVHERDILNRYILQ